MTRVCAFSKSLAVIAPRKPITARTRDCSSSSVCSVSGCVGASLPVSRAAASLAVSEATCTWRANANWSGASRKPRISPGSNDLLWANAAAASIHLSSCPSCFFIWPKASKYICRILLPTPDREQRASDARVLRLRVVVALAHRWVHRGEQRQQIFGGEATGDIGAVEHAGDQRALVAVHAHDLLLDGAAHDQAIHRHRLGLADAVRPIGRLVLDRGV